jgi:hypothetical protein
MMTAARACFKDRRFCHRSLSFFRPASEIRASHRALPPASCGKDYDFIGIKAIVAP